MSYQCQVNNSESYMVSMLLFFVQIDEQAGITGRKALELSCTERNCRQERNMMVQLFISKIIATHIYNYNLIRSACEQEYGTDRPYHPRCNRLDHHYAWLCLPLLAGSDRADTPGYRRNRILSSIQDHRIQKLQQLLMDTHPVRHFFSIRTLEASS
jgi:hypothetical protein